jgi:acetolactate synthase small subunit
VNLTLTQDLPQAAPRCTPAGRERTLEIELCDAPDALVRVLTMLQRRRCRITAVEFAAADRHRPGRLVITLEPPGRHAHCVVAWVAGLVDVVGVDELRG